MRSKQSKGDPRESYVGIRVMIPEARARQPRDGAMNCGSQSADISKIIVAYQPRVACPLRCWFSKTPKHVKHETQVRQALAALDDYRPYQTLRLGGSMKKSKFSESQIVAILKEGEAGIAVTELIRKHGISAATYYNWKSKYAGVEVSDLKRMKELETENAKLKRMYAELALENTAIKDVLNRKL